MLYKVRMGSDNIFELELGDFNISKNFVSWQPSYVMVFLPSNSEILTA